MHCAFSSPTIPLCPPRIVPLVELPWPALGRDRAGRRREHSLQGWGHMDFLASQCSSDHQYPSLLTDSSTNDLSHPYRYAQSLQAIRRPWRCRVPRSSGYSFVSFYCYRHLPFQSAHQCPQTTSSAVNQAALRRSFKVARASGQGSQKHARRLSNASFFVLLAPGGAPSHGHGQGQRGREHQDVNEHLRGEEARFLVRTLAQNLRVGAVRTTILSALARASALSSNPADYWRSIRLRRT
jgi:hypothetical protein